MKTVFVVLIEWVREFESNTSVQLYSDIEKAKDYLRKESLIELEHYKGNTIYYEEEDGSYIKELLAQLDNDFKIVDDEECANWVVQASTTHFSVYKKDEYPTDHFAIDIFEKIIDEEIT